MPYLEFKVIELFLISDINNIILHYDHKELLPLKINVNWANAAKDMTDVDIITNYELHESNISYSLYDLSKNSSKNLLSISANISEKDIPIYQNITISYSDIVNNVLIGIALSIICLMTIAGNLLVLIALCINSRLRTTTNYLIANLAIADLLLGSLVLPFSLILEVTNVWILGTLICNMWTALDVLCCTASIMSLCVISIDRYIGVSRPLQHHLIISEKRVIIILVFVWILSGFISIVPLFGWKDPESSTENSCTVNQNIGYVIFSASGSFYIPLTIILIVYGRVYVIATRSAKNLRNGVTKTKNKENTKQTVLRVHTGQSFKSSQQHQRLNSVSSHRATKLKQQTKAAKTLGIVVGVFILCWCPFFILLPIESICSECKAPSWLFKLIFWLGYCNSMMNPIIYAFWSKEFKKAFLSILTCKKYEEKSIKRICKKYNSFNPQPTKKSEKLFKLGKKDKNDLPQHNLNKSNISEKLSTETKCEGVDEQNAILEPKTFTKNNFWNECPKTNTGLKNTLEYTFEVQSHCIQKTTFNSKSSICSTDLSISDEV